ncbi:MAG: tRNA (adenosine(37)-N6)-dimethylallyltransferase MiaA [Candidatus Margulisiibacteriota bacterium]
MKKAVLLFGPTATGKTELAARIASQKDAEIISADSMQVYRYMDIGTAKPTQEQRARAIHHLIDVVDPDEEWNVSLFINNAKKLCEEISQKKKLPLIVGGTGLYLNAFINDFSFPIASASGKIRQELLKRSVEELRKELEKADPVSADKISPNDKKRTVRALEVFLQTGTAISALQKNRERDDLVLICLEDERGALYTRINERVDNMMRMGLAEEVASLLKKGYSKDLVSMQALGYKEIVEYIESRLTKEEAVELIKKRTRNFAKRQISWFGRFKNVHRIDVSPGALNTADKILSLLF